MMSVVRKLARILGPRKLMPNLKLGTVCEDVEAKVASLLRAIPFQACREGTITVPLGPTSFTSNQISQNFLSSLQRAGESCSLIGKSGNLFSTVCLTMEGGPKISVADAKLK